MNTETNSTVLRETRGDRARAGGRSRYLKRHSGPAAIPYLQIVEDAEGRRLQRFGEGFFFLKDGLPDPDQPEGLSALDLAYPVKEVRKRGTVYRGRWERRADEREDRTAKKKRTQRRVRLAEERRHERLVDELEAHREQSRREADEDRKQVLHGEEVRA